MSDVTKNYGLKKPSPEDFYDINVFNENMDKIDDELKKKSKLLTDDDDLRLILEDGHYYWDPENAPSGMPTEADGYIFDNLRFMRVWGDDHGCFQEVADGDYTLQRYVTAGGFAAPWEWINPPMFEGVRYRTTERYQENPVYVMLGSDGIIHKTDDTGTDFTPITYGTTDLIAGSSALETGKLYFVYE